MSLISKLKGLPFARKDMVQELLFLSILVTPFQNVVDLIWMFTVSDLDEWWVVNTPVAIKITKDLLLVALLGISVLNLRKLSALNQKIFALFGSILVYVSIKSFLNHTPLPIIVAGIRWYLPLFLFPFFDNYSLEKESFLAFFNRYKFVVYLALLLQTFQILFSGRWGLCTPYLIGCRASGFFAMPQPMSLFSLFFLALILKLPSSLRQKKDYIASIVSVFLTKSAAGFLGLGAMLFFTAKKKFKIIAFFVSLGCMILFPFITGRDGYWISPLTRLEILQRINYSNIIFGTYTNTCNNFKHLAPLGTPCAVPDSFLASLLGNLGIGLTLAILGAICFYIYKSKRYFYFAILLIMLAAGSYTEYFPTNILFPLFVGLKIKDSERVDQEEAHIS